MPGPEAKVESKVVDFAESIGVYSRKFTSPGTRDVPDRLFQYGGWVMFIEFKRHGETPTDAQQDEIRLIRATGGLATWVSGVGAGNNLLKLFRKGEFTKLHDLCRHINFWEA